MKVLVADDDRDLTDLLRYIFQREGYQVVMAFDGEAALRLFASESPDLLVLDLRMPKRSGSDVLQDIRRHSLSPILVLSSADEEEQVVEALRLGADDYVVKPFRPRELLARAAAVLRRSALTATTSAHAHAVLSLSEVNLDPHKREVLVGDRTVHLTRIEFDLLHYLMLNRNRVIVPTELIANVWGYDDDAGEDIVKVNISRLRHKLEPDPAQPRYILTVHGVGYIFPHKP